ncbi:MAG: hypothetical protein LBN40_00860 [Oscillospiraceae bacterium]|jgi:hypothetical protein|nr:hypothetical protein [Oscillospiraceae bacterium]
MNKNRSTTIITAAVALLAVAAVVFAVIKVSQSERIRQEFEDEKEQTFIPSAELLVEMQDNAERLVAADYEIVKLFYTKGLDHEPEPYGNLPEDGYFFAVSDKYKTLDSIYELLFNTFTKETADAIKASDKTYADREGRLGISEKFAPNTGYDIDWTEPSYVITAEAEDKCTLGLTLKHAGEPLNITVGMTKQGGIWLLDELIYE